MGLQYGTESIHPRPSSIRVYDEWRHGNDVAGTRASVREGEDGYD